MSTAPVADVLTTRPLELQKLVFVASCMTLSIKGDSVKNKPAGLFIVPFGTTLNEISPISEWQRGGSKLLSEIVIVKRLETLSEIVKWLETPRQRSDDRVVWSVCF